jgi:hypothetical protein
MASEAAVVGRRQVVAAFVGLAIVTGPIAALTSNPFYFGLPWLAPWTTAAASGGAGIVLLGMCRAKGWPLLRAREWLVVAVLLMPQFAANVASISRLHETRWGVMFLIRVAAPLWLALLSALQLVRAEVPRATVGAAIAGIGAVCLMTPVDAFRVAANQAPMAVVHLLVGVATVYTWVYAAQRLAGAGAVACAGSFLLLDAALKFGSSRLSAVSPPQGFGWHEVWVAMTVQAVVVGCSSYLWFWLLGRMRLAAFCMSALAMWTATMLPGVVLFGFLQWRVDVAVAIAVGAIVVALRAQVADEQPTALGLGRT